MQKTANATTMFARIITAARAALAARSVPESYSINVPGLGLIGDYATVTEAESALHYLPYSARQRATICDQDGYCVVR